MILKLLIEMIKMHFYFRYTKIIKGTKIKTNKKKKDFIAKGMDKYENALKNFSGTTKKSTIAIVLAFILKIIL